MKLSIALMLLSLRLTMLHFTLVSCLSLQVDEPHKGYVTPLSMRQLGHCLLAGVPQMQHGGYSRLSSFGSSMRVIGAPSSHTSISPQSGHKTPCQLSSYLTLLAFTDSHLLHIKLAIGLASSRQSYSRALARSHSVVARSPCSPPSSGSKATRHRPKPPAAASPASMARQAPITSSCCGLPLRTR